MNYRDTFLLKNKIAVVTGGAGLIGKEIVKGLLDFGAEVYIADVSKNIYEDHISSNTHNIHLDITSARSVHNGIKKIIELSKKIDILINCAYPRTQDWGEKFENISFESWKENVNDHLGGYFLCCQKSADQMKLQQNGSIINLASIYGVVAPDFSVYKNTDMTMPAAYSAIKGGIITFTKYLATYFGKYNIRANVVSPGGIFDNQSPSFIEKYCQKTPLGKMATPQDVVGAIIFLASDASSYVTGQNIIIDGGWTAW